MLHGKCARHVVSCTNPMHTDAALPDEPRSIEQTVRTLNREPSAGPELAEDADDDLPSARAREGLPKAYRSRHDRHYVEQLTSSTSMPLLRMLAVSRIDAANLPDPRDVMALTASVAQLGILQPLLVRAQDERFVLIAGRKRLVAAQQAHLREVPCLVYTADDARAEELAQAANASSSERRERIPHAGGAPVARIECDALSESLLPEIQHAIGSVQRSLRLLPQSPAATRDRVAMRLMNVELERALWLVRCRRYLAGRLPFVARPEALSSLAKEFRGASAGIALHGGQLEVEPASEGLSVAADVPLLTAAVHGLSWALLALGETVADPRVRIGFGLISQDATVLALTQPTAVLNQPTLLRFFDAGWKARPGGAAAELAVQLARYAAARHGTELEVSSSTAAGTSITLTFRS
jgi:hypothetical protein